MSHFSASMAVSSSQNVYDPLNWAYGVSSCDGESVSMCISMCLLFDYISVHGRACLSCYVCVSMSVYLYLIVFKCMYLYIFFATISSWCITTYTFANIILLCISVCILANISSWCSIVCNLQISLHTYASLTLL